MDGLLEQQYLAQLAQPLVCDAHVVLVVGEACGDGPHLVRVGARARA